MKNIFLVWLLVSVNLIYSQKTKDKISISFENSTRISVINAIEKQTDYHFYYLEKWIGSSLISGDYKDIHITALLDEIFKNTVLNYYISPEHKVILTRSILIHDSLHNAFFKTKKSVQNEDVKTPFFKEELSEKNGKVSVVRIGREKKYSKQKTFILSGYVKNNTTKEALANVAILIEGKNIYTTTNSKGYYTIKLPSGVNYITLKALGVEDYNKRVVIYDNGKLNFYLNESLEALSEVVVKVNKDKNVIRAVTGVTQIKVAEIKNIPLILGERDLLKVATTLPGISNAGEGASGFNVRGGKEDQNLILLDEGVIYNPVHFFGIFSAINPFTTGNVNIYKGSIPAEYGGRLSSVFDIATKNGNNKDFAAEVSIGPVTSNITLEVPIVKDKSSFLIGGRATYSDWILKSLDEKSLKNSSASFYDIIAKYNHKISKKTSIETTGYYSRDVFSITSDSLFSYSNRLLTLKLSHSFNNKNKGNIILTNSVYKFNIGYDGGIDNNFDLNYKINETQLKFNMKYLYSDTHKFDYGVSTKLYIINPGDINPESSGSIIKPLNIPQEQAVESAIYISDKFKLSDKFMFNLGVRYSMYSALGEASQRVFKEGFPRTEETVVDVLTFDKNEVVKTYGGPEVRASARYLFSPSFSMKASFNSSYQYIHMLSTNTTISPTDTWKLSNLNIKPQQGNQYSLGLYKNFTDDMYEFSVEGFYKKSSNIIDYKVGADLLLKESVETEILQGEGKAYGLEFLLKKTRGKFNGWLGYTYSRSLFKLDSKFSEERINNGAYFSSNYDKPHDVSLVVNYKITKRFSFSANASYQTGRPVTFPIGNYMFNGSEHVLYSNRNEFRIPDYYRLDLGFNMEGNHKIKKFTHSFWNISIYNVLGRNNPYSVFFVTENGQIKAKQSSIFSVPIPTLTFNFKF